LPLLDVLVGPESCHGEPGEVLLVKPHHPLDVIAMRLDTEAWS
jgi:hypothetical protein